MACSKGCTELKDRQVHGQHQCPDDAAEYHHDQRLHEAGKVVHQVVDVSRPFCSDRCKLIDLGAWASEEHKIPVSPDAEDDLFSEDFQPKH